MKKSTLLLALAGLMSGSAFAAPTLTTVASSGSYGYYLDSSCSWVVDHSGSSGFFQHLQCGSDTVANYAQTNNGCTLVLTANSNDYYKEGSSCYSYKISKVTSDEPSNPSDPVWVADAYSADNGCRWVNEYTGGGIIYKRLECSGSVVARLDQNDYNCRSYLTNTKDYTMTQSSCWSFSIYRK